MFNPIDGREVSKNIALQIEAAILRNEYKLGERLPSERDLQSYFHTGRGVIREALRELKQKGLIETRRGGHGGTYVKQVGASEAGQALALLIQQRRIAIESLVEFRESVDRTVTLLAISRGGDQEVEDLLTAVAELKRAGLSEFPEMNRILQIDRELNLLLVKMTKNPIFEWIMRTIQLSFGSYDNVLYEDPYFREKTIQNWYETVAAIVDREPLKALSFIGYHYVMLNRCIQENRCDSAGGGTQSLR